MKFRIPLRRALRALCVLCGKNVFLATANGGAMVSQLSVVKMTLKNLPKSLLEIDAHELLFR